MTSREPVSDPPSRSRRLRATVAAVGTAIFVMTMEARARATEFEAGGGFNLDFNANATTAATLRFTDGSSQTITTGNGVILSAGAGAIFFGPQPHRLETLLTVGVKYSTMRPADNADLSFVRVPIELLAFYRNDHFHFRVGGGMALYVDNSLSGSGAASGIDLTFDPAVAGIAQADFIAGGFFAGIRYTALNFHTESSSTGYSASSIGIGVGYYYHFPGE